MLNYFSVSENAADQSPYLVLSIATVFHTLIIGSVMHLFIFSAVISLEVSLKRFVIV